ncbi:lipoprotein [Streptomyces capoamus]|uniref:Lipoprotein n=2 Tax=Streptomyces capoamus TaxID=68183 RepID=A0A919C535_9ACTN|nr:lipoprotein [Streptomyces capoamus]
MSVSRTLTASAICVTAALGVTACSGDGSSDQPFKGQSADQVAAKAVAATRNSESLRMAGKVSADGQPLTVDFHVDTQKNCKGRMAMQRGSADVIHAGQATYIKGDKEFWAGAAENSGGRRKQTEALSGRWVKVPVGDSRTTGLCDKQGFLADMDSDKSERKGMTKGDVTTVNGHKALPLKKKKGAETITMYVATEGKPYILKLHQSGGDNPGTIVFSDYGKPVKATPPPAGQVIDGTKGGKAAS